MIRALNNFIRHTAAAARGGTVRYYCGNLRQFYAALRSEGISPVVIRWDRETPLSKKSEREYRYDVDHLISNNHAKKIGQIAARFPGKIKCDFYSASGQSGSAYQGMPYYPPVKALELIEHAVLHEDGYTHLEGSDAFFSYAYHLCYHKGPKCQISLDSDSPEPSVKGSRDYRAELYRLAENASVPLPESITIIALDQLLRESGWGMPYDLMTRWPDQHPYLLSLIERQATAMEKDSELAADLTIFVIREDCGGQEMKDLVKEMVGKRFSILREISITNDQQKLLMSHTRGGDWIEKYVCDVVPPVEALICRNSESPGPVPGGLSPQKLEQRYPQVENTDVLIKREIRNRVNRQLGGHSDRVVVHATDNKVESGEMLRVLLGDNWDKQLFG
ncbi:hypothetical protein N9B42_01560 [Akkermansiaceae bacterium]|nr:hypothetical protein [Akkermansiaceae bacterium]MDB0068409.1 hypothetical protein [Akkermansiaceae bacterium]MDB4284063.1 hypothetical protein [Akkermansiaceae bacterium]MDB4434151.1 hypothetical protein [Akkermansiaceae bacterium]